METIYLKLDVWLDFLFYFVLFCDTLAMLGMKWNSYGRCSVRLLLHVFAWWLVSYLCYLCLVYGGVQHILCCVVVLLVFYYWNNIFLNYILFLIYYEILKIKKSSNHQSNVNVSKYIQCDKCNSCLIICLTTFWFSPVVLEWSAQ
jgi:hypothetical protein